MSKRIKVLICSQGSMDSEVIGQLKKYDLVIARGALSVAWLRQNQINQIQIFSAPKQQPIASWIDESLGLSDISSVAYVTDVSPLFTDVVALELLKIAGKENTTFVEGSSVTNSLMASLDCISTQPMVTLDGLLLRDRHHPPFSADNNILIQSPGTGEDIIHLQKLLGLIFPSAHIIQVADSRDGRNLVWKKIPLSELNTITGEPSAIFIPSSSKDASLEQFQEIIAHLRAPEDGCPWDKKQTHASLRTYLLEETYEALDALDKNDISSLKEELGDILLQILLHAQIASEEAEFTMADVLSGINRKIVYRHPHVFKDWVVNGEKDVVQNWESLKGQERLEKGDASKKGMLDGVPMSYPSLAQAQAIQDRAARVGFDWPDIGPVFDKVMEELEEVKTAANDVERAKELGDLLFALVNVIRWYKVDSESALRQTNLKFRKRFAYIEEQARLTGKDMQRMTLAEMDEFWEQAKQFDV